MLVLVPVAEFFSERDSIWAEDIYAGSTGGIEEPISRRREHVG